MDTTPATALGRVHHDIQIILQKSCPYLENDFAKPVSATTMDEVQLSTAVLALQRLHDGAPNSEHSKALQGSVWQVAGSPTLCIPPLFNLPSWILDRSEDEEYLSRLPLAMVVALVVVWLCAPRKLGMIHMSKILAVLQRMNNPKFTLAPLVIGAFDYVMLREPKHLTRII